MAESSNGLHKVGRLRTVAVIIPAYNEEEGIADVLRAALDSRLATEIIVVSDGSVDRTARVASTFRGVRVIDLKANVGKGGAMCAGVDSTQADVVAFVDADLIGLTGRHIDSIIAPIQQGLCDVCLGVFRGGKLLSNASQIIFPYISGQRAMTRALFLKIPNLRELRFGVELGMHNYQKLTHRTVKRVVLRDVSNSYKEHKYGIKKGIQARRKMFGEMYRANAMARRRAHLYRRKNTRRLTKKLLDLDSSEITMAIKKLRRKNPEDK